MSLSKSIFRWLLIAVGVAAAAGVVYVALQPKPVPVDVAEVTRGGMIVTVDEDGQTRIQERYVVSAPLSGRLLRVELDPGDQVVQGRQLLGPRLSLAQRADRPARDAIIAILGQGQQGLAGQRLIGHLAQRLGHRVPHVGVPVPRPAGDHPDVLGLPHVAQRAQQRYAARSAPRRRRVIPL